MQEYPKMSFAGVYLNYSQKAEKKRPYKRRGRYHCLLAKDSVLR